MLGHGAEFGHKREQAIAALLSHRNVDEAARAVTTPKTSAQTVAHFAKPDRTPRRERAENSKTIPKTARRTVKTLNKGPNFRMFDTYATPPG
jgi:hypothetical protein